MKKIFAALALGCTAMVFVACQDNTCEVTFTVDGVQYGKTLEVKKGESVSLPAAPEKEGYRFIDWYESGEEEPFDAATAINRDYSLIAKFDENVYTLVFDGGDAEGAMSSVELTYTQEYTLPECSFVWQDHAFAGWATEADGESVYADGAVVSKLTAEHEATVTLYAVWSEQFYTVSFDGGEGLGSMQSINVSMEGEAALPACGFLRKGWHFVGWATEKDGEPVYSDQETISGLTDTLGGNVTLYAVWEEDSYTVRFHADGAEGSMADQTVKVSESVALSTNAYTKDGFTFLGWATEEGGEVVYEDGATVSALSDQNGAVVDLYAVFRGAPEKYTLVTKVEQADGSFEESSKQVDSYYGETITLTPEEKRGYEWKVLNNGAVLDGGDDTVLTVEYTLKEYTVTVMGIYGDKKFEAAKQTFTYLTETFDVDVSGEATADGRHYRFVSSEQTLKVVKDTAEDVVFEAKYAIGVSTPQEFMDAYVYNGTLDLYLENDIDFAEYVKANPWTSDTPYFVFDYKSFSGTLDGQGHRLTGLNRGINDDGSYTYNRHYGYFGNVAGTIKNIYIQSEVAITCGENGFNNGSIIQTLSGTLENCVIDMTIHYDVDWGAWDCGMMETITDTAVVKNCVFLVNNHTPGALFGKNGANFTAENVVFVGNYNIEAGNLFRANAEGGHNPNMKNVFVYQSEAKAVAGEGYALKANYTECEAVSGAELWEKTSATLAQLASGLSGQFSDSYKVVTRVEQMDGTFTESEESFTGKLFATPSVTADAKEGYEVSIKNNDALLCGDGKTVVTVEYTFERYTVTLTGVSGEKLFEASSQAFKPTTESFILQFPEEVTVDGVVYTLVSVTENPEIPANNRENLEFKAQYRVEVSTAEEFVNAMNHAYSSDIVLDSDIDLAEYVKANPWTSDTPYFYFNWGSFTGTLDGQGHRLTGLNRGINDDGSYTYSRHYGYFGGVAGTFKNLYIQSEVAINCGEGGFQNGSIIQTLSGTMENCVVDMTIHYDVDWGAWDCGMFESIADSAVVKNCVFLVNNHTPGSLFGKNGSNFTAENVAFVGNYNIEAGNLFRANAQGGHNPNMKNVYVYQTAAKAIAGEGYALKANYTECEAVSGAELWETTSTPLAQLFSGMSDLFTDTYTVVTKIQQSDGTFAESEESFKGKLFTVPSVTADAKEGYEVSVNTDNAFLWGNGKASAVVEYTLIGYKATLYGVCGGVRFEAKSQIFTSASETFAMQFPEEITVDGVLYRLAGETEDAVISGNTAEDVEFEAQYNAVVGTAEEFVYAMNNLLTANIILDNDIDLAAYIKANPWTSDTPYFVFNWGSFTGTLDGQGHKLTGLNRGINDDGSYTYNRHYGYFGNVAGTFKNLYIQSEVAIFCGEGFNNGSIIQTLSGTLENCVVDMTIHYDIDWGAWECGMFESISDSAVVKNCVFLVNNHTPGSLFGRNGSNFTAENVAFVGNYNIEAGNLFRANAQGGHNPNMKNVYVYQTAAKAIAGEGYALKANYTECEAVSGAELWETTSAPLAQLFSGLSEIIGDTYKVVTKIQQSDGTYTEEVHSYAGTLFATPAVQAEEKAGYTLSISGNDAFLRGDGKTVVTVEYTLVGHKATLIAVSGAHREEIKKQIFPDTTEGFTMSFPEEVTIGGITYRLVTETEDAVIPANTAEDLTFEAEYEVVVRTAEDLVNAMNGAADANIVLDNDIDMTDYLRAHPWNTSDAFFTVPLTGKLDGQGHSVLNLVSTAGLVKRYENAVFREISATGVLTDLHLQVSIGLSGEEGERLGLLIGNMYGTVENCFFEIDAQFNVDWYMYGAAPIFNLAETAKIRNSAFYIPSASGLRMICSTSWGGAFEGMGSFENVAYIYGNSDVNNSLPTLYNPNIKNIYIIRADKTAGAFNDAKALNSESYAAAAGDGAKNSAAYWDATTFEAISAAMTGFTFTENKIMYGDRVIAQYGEVTDISNAFQFVAAIRNNPAGSFRLTQDIDMSEYLRAYPWDWTDVRAFFDFTFSGTLDGQGHSILNFTSTAGIIDRWENVVFREIAPEGTIRNLHMKVSLGIQTGGWDRALLFGNMYGTVENCFFEIDVQANESAMNGTAAFYRVGKDTVVRNTVFYISAPLSFRLMCASTGDGSIYGTFENVAYVYGNFEYNGLLPQSVNAGISDIYLIKVDETAGTFSDAKALKEEYATGTATGGADLWADTTLEEITKAMNGFTFTENKILYGETVIKDFSVTE